MTPTALGRPRIRTTLRRLLTWLRPERRRLILLLGLSAIALGLNMIPAIGIGAATNVIFDGYLSSQFEAGETKGEVIERLELAGDQAQAEFLRGIDLRPGDGIDVAALSVYLGLTLIAGVLSHVLQWRIDLLGWRVGIEVATRMRAQMESKVHRLSLRFVDGSPRGDLVSRLVNDADNVRMSLMMSLRQVPALLGIVVALVVMVLVSPLLTFVMLVVLPLLLVTLAVIGRRSRKLYAAQWTHVGELTAQVEEAYSGHALVRLFGRRREIGDRFEQENRQLAAAAFGAQAVGGTISPSIRFLDNLAFVAIALLGGLLVAGGATSLGGVQTVLMLSNSLLFWMSNLGFLTQVAQSGLASTERVFGLLDAEEDDPDPVASDDLPRGPGRLVFEDISFRYDPETPLIDGLSLVAEPVGSPGTELEFAL